MTDLKKFILASRSPRRKELLEKCGIIFECIPADIDETLDPSVSLREAVENLSFRKASAILCQHPDAVVIGSDTIVTLDGEVLGKPSDRNDACRMLEMLSGRKHEVITGFCMISSKRSFCTSSVAEVTFAQMSQQEIADYAASGECDDKAGAYAIQGYFAKHIDHIEGSYENVIGFPGARIEKEIIKMEE